ncbi:hypothetical protein TNCV_4298531 [Trichonephila clavipes]|nr:hypothetical protein TNCV_4298531 [Trichonephila clavipes]
MPKSNAQKEFRERKKKEKLAASPVKKKEQPPQKNIANSLSATDKCLSEYMREYRARIKKTLQNTLLMIRYNCRQSLSKKSIPNLSKYNGFVYPEIPGHISTLDFVAERLILARILFMQIRRLRHVLGKFGILG